MAVKITRTPSPIERVEANCFRESSDRIRVSMFYAPRVGIQILSGNTVLAVVLPRDEAREFFEACIEALVSFENGVQC